MRLMELANSRIKAGRTWLLPPQMRRLNQGGESERVVCGEFSCNWLEKVSRVWSCGEDKWLCSPVKCCASVLCFPFHVSSAIVVTLFSRVLFSRFFRSSCRSKRASSKCIIWDKYAYVNN